MSSLENLPNIQIINTSLVQSLSERGRNTSKLLLQGHYYSDTNRDKDNTENTTDK